jgi:hypothetical protein
MCAAGSHDRLLVCLCVCGGGCGIGAVAVVLFCVESGHGLFLLALSFDPSWLRGVCLVFYTANACALGVCGGGVVAGFGGCSPCKQLQGGTEDGDRVSRGACVCV